MRLDQVLKAYHVGYRHSPDHFYPGSFEVESDGKRLILVAVVKRHIKKRYRIVGVLRPKA